MTCHFILYVRDQTASTSFYCSILGQEPTLNVPGMTEFQLEPNCILGLMPEKGIKRLLGDAIRDPEATTGASRAELYLRVSDPKIYMNRAKELSAKILSEIKARDWGDEAGYIMDPDGHVVAFARPL